MNATIFVNCQGKNGTAIYIRSDYFTFKNCQFINHFTGKSIDDDDEYSTTYFYLDAAHTKTNIQIEETVFMNNSGQTMEMTTINNFANCQFIDNNKFIENYTLINCERVQASITGFENCSFISNRGRCIYSEMIQCIFLSIGYSKFINNSGPNGACICVYSDSLEQNELALVKNEWINNIVFADPVC